MSDYRPVEETKPVNESKKKQEANVFITTYADLESRYFDDNQKLV